MLDHFSEAWRSVRRAGAAADCHGFSAFRWARLWLALARSGADENVARRLVSSELTYQRRIWSDPPLPAWAAALTPAGMQRPLTPHTTSVEADSVNLRRLVLALDASRHERTPLSVRARDWAAGRPGLGERWADAALRRLEAMGILTKGPGVRRLPTWNLVPREEALQRLRDV